MAIYIALVFIIILCGFFKRKKDVKRYMAFLCFLLVMIIGLRAPSIGTDTNGYNQIYWRIGHSPLFSEEVKDPLFILLNKGVSLFGDFQLLLIVEAVLITLPMIRFTYERSKLAWLSILLYIAMGHFNQSMNVSRQYIAIGFSLSAASCAFKGQRRKFLINILLGALFHKSAIVCLLFYPLIRLKSKLVTHLCYIGLFSGALLMPLFLALLKRILPVEGHYGSNGEGMALLLLSLALLVILFLKSLETTDRMIIIEIRLLCVAIIFHMCVGQLVVVGRLAYYFYIPFYLLLPNVVGKFFTPRSRKIAYAGMALILAVYYCHALPGGFSQTVPYAFYFSD